MNKQEIYSLLQQKGIWFEAYEHPAVFNMAEMAQISIPHQEADAKNLFVRDDKKRNYYLITVKGDKKVDLREFQQAQQTRRLGFASEKDLQEILELFPGAVTPLGLLNDKDCSVKLFLDKFFLEEPGLIGVHPNDNTATVCLKTASLLELIREHGNAVEIVEI